METKTKLKNSTQQKRVELIETQKWELIAATATIDNLKLDLENSEKIINEIKQANIKLIDECSLLTKARDRNMELNIDLIERNGNLKTITNDQTERIEVMQHELKNYESAIEVLEVKETRINELYLAYEKRNQELEGLMSKATESRERLASKFTNWFIFLVLTNIVSIAWGVYQLLTK